MNVLVTIKGSQFMGLPYMGSDSVEMITSGFLDKTPEGYKLTYTENEMTGLGHTTTTLYIDAGRITLVRSGDVATQMVFEQGRKHLSYYETEFGAFTVGVNASRVTSSIGEAGGELEMMYNIDIDNAMAGVDTINISVAPDFAPPPGAVPLSYAMGDRFYH